MGTVRWERVRRVLEEALERDAAERPAFLDDVCKDAPDVRREVESLIARDDQIDDLDEPALGLASSAPPVSGPTPERIGEYRIIQRIAAGGMGVVYEAEQQQPRRRVALKVVRGGRFVDEHSVRMFKREVDTLARLHHPNIAAIYESGRTEEGEHFFAMELLRGSTLDRFIETRPAVLSAEEQELRLRLGRKLADAVHYAHQRGVVHRDLKPTNVMVGDVGRTDEMSESGVQTPEIKILDFGLAQITESDVAVTRSTAIGVIKGTLAYMSPEQARGHADQIDVRTDVYSLGVMLYELLTGRRPYDVRDVSLAEALCMISEQPPAPLRQSWSGVGKPDPDLETIVFKALEKDPDQRYASAAALAEDIERYLTLQPIIARPTSAMYQLRKFARRNRAAVTATVIAMAVLVVGATVAGVAAVRATRAERQAVAALAASERDARTATEVTAFMARAFQVNDPAESRGRQVTAREVLDNAAARIQTELADQPDIRTVLTGTIGGVYHRLGVLDEAEWLLDQAADDALRLFGSDHRVTLQISYGLASVYMDQGRYEAAAPMLLGTLGTQERLLGSDHPDTLTTMADLLLAYWNLQWYEKAEPVYLKTLEAQRRVFGNEHLKTLLTLNNFAGMYEHQGRYDKAEPLYLEAVESQRRLFGDDHPRTLAFMNNLAGLWVKQERYEEAALWLRDTLDKRIAILGERHPHVAYSHYNLGCLAAATGGREKALDHLRQAVDLGWARRSILDDRALSSLRGDPEFELIVRRVVRQIDDSVR